MHRWKIAYPPAAVSVIGDAEDRLLPPAAPGRGLDQPRYAVRPNSLAARSPAQNVWLIHTSISVTKWQNADHP